MEMRKCYQRKLAELMMHNQKVVMVDADLVSASGSGENFKQFPHQTINVGISEANMISASAGMSATGIIPFIHSFAPFVTRRVYDQLFMSGVYSKNRFHIYGSDPGFWAQHNGGTHTSYEDIALMRALPNVVITAPCDPAQFRFAIDSFMADNTVYYTRATRKDLPDLYDESTSFALGKIITHGTGTDCVIFAMGEMLHEALNAQQQLKEQGIDTTVLDCFSLKPFDTETAQDMIRKTKVVITIENHSIIGGLHAIVAEVMAKTQHHAILYPIAVMDTFGEVGTSTYLQKKHRLHADYIVELAKQHVNKQ